MRRTSLVLIGFLIITACTAARPDETGKPSSSASSSLSSTTSKTSTTSAASVPAASALDVPFTSQAPYANWDDPYQEACEEASLLMVVHYLNGTPLSPEIADREIIDLVAWEKEHGYGEDATAEQMAEIARKKFDLRARVRTDVSAETIKEELAVGNPVVVPVAGRDLGNPYFSGAGPWYHTLVITGYREGWTGRRYFITNDPGTKHGKGYEYGVVTLLNAVHDWTGVKEEIRSGRKAMVVLEK